MDPTRAPADQIRDEAHLAGTCHQLNDSYSLDEAERTLPSDPSDDDALLVALAADIQLGGDPLGDAFTRLRSGEDRRELGQFYTPDEIVDSMVTWTLGHTPTRVIDPGCGSGRYALALRNAGFTGQLIASDVDPLATLMVKASASVLEVDIDIRLESFLDLDLDEIEGTTSFVGNPPYVRHHSLSRADKLWAKQVAGDLGTTVSGLAGLHALFFLKVAEQSRSGDTCSFITSSEWFDTKYGSIVRTLLTGPLGLECIDAVDPKATTFDDVLTTAVITSSVTGNIDEHVTVRTVVDPSELATLDGGENTGRAQLAGAPGWTRLLAGESDEGDGLVPLGTYFKVKRGVATGNNKFFLRTVDEIDRLGLSDYAHPCVSRSSELGDSGGEIDTSKIAKRLLVLPTTLADPNVASLVAAGEEAEAHTGFICRQRNPWWSLTRPTPPAVFAVYMARKPPRFVKNAAQITHTNVVHALYPHDGVSPDDVTLLVDWLASNAETLTAGRTYHGGLNKWEPSEMMALRVPAIDTLRT